MTRQQLQIGCYIDGSYRNETGNTTALIQLAKSYGYKPESDWYEDWDGDSDLTEDQEGELDSCG